MRYYIFEEALMVSPGLFFPLILSLSPLTSTSSITGISYNCLRITIKTLMKLRMKTTNAFYNRHTWHDKSQTISQIIIKIATSSKYNSDIKPNCLSVIAKLSLKCYSNEIVNPGKNLTFIFLYTKRKKYSVT